LTRSNPQGEIGFLPDIRSMNVGMTRARRKLLLVDDSSTLCRHPFFVELLAHVKGGVTAQRMRWANRIEFMMAVTITKVHKSVFAYYASLVPSDMRAVRQ